jgi:hypothetical protein
MLAIWRVHGVDLALREAWERGAVLGGWSAGANCWFEDSVTDSFGPELRELGGGLGLLPGASAPLRRRARAAADVHASRSATASPTRLRRRRRRRLPLRGTELLEVVSQREGACGYRVDAGAARRRSNYACCETGRDPRERERQWEDNARAVSSLGASRCRSMSSTHSITAPAGRRRPPTSCARVWRRSSRRRVGRRRAYRGKLGDLVLERAELVGGSTCLCAFGCHAWSDEPCGESSGARSSGAATARACAARSSVATR